MTDHDRPPDTAPHPDMVTVADAIVLPTESASTARRKRRIARQTTDTGARPRLGRWMLALTGSFVLVLAQADIPGTTPLAQDPVVETVAAAPPPVVDTGTLIVRTVPSEVRVSINGDDHGMTPLTLRDLAVGHYTVDLMSEQGRIKRTVTIKANDTTAVVETLVSGWAAIFSRVRLDIYRHGKLLGSTEGDHIMLPPGRHQLDLVNERLGFRTSHVLEIEPGGVTAYDVPLPSGTVRLEGVAGTEIAVDGTSLGRLPLAPIQVPIGTREFVARFMDGAEQLTMIDVTAGTPMTLDLATAAAGTRKGVLTVYPSGN